MLKSNLAQVAELVDALDSKSVPATVGSIPTLGTIFLNERIKKFRFNNILFALVLLFILIQLYPSFNRSSNNFDKFGHVEELYKIILNNYHKSISEDTLVQFIRDGIFNNLDPYPVYLRKI